METDFDYALSDRHPERSRRVLNVQTIFNSDFIKRH
jgi:hypothetical protein